MEKTTEFVKKYAQMVTGAFLLLIIVVFPFYVPEGYVEIGVHKFLFFKAAGLVCLGLLAPAAVWLLIFELKNFKLKKGKVRLSATDVSLLLYGAAVLVSHICTEWRADALWGAEGWYMGTITQLMFIAVYFAVSRFVANGKTWYMVGVGVSAVVFLLGLLNRFSVYPLALQGAEPGYISTLGNINWFCSYWMVLFPVGIVAYWNGFGDTLPKKAGIVLYLWLGFMTGMAQGSSSGFLALGAVGFVLFFLSFKSGERLLKWMELVICFAVSALTLSVLKNQFPGNYNYRNAIGEFLTKYSVGFLLFAFSVVCYAVLHFLIKKKKIKGKGLLMIRNAVTILMVFLLAGIFLLTYFYSNNPESAGHSQMAEQFILDSDWGNGRGVTWYAGAKGFAAMSFAQKLVGIGPDCFYHYVYEVDEIAMKLYEVFGEARLTNAHNEWLTVLVNTGLFGLLTYAAAFCSAVFRLLKAGKRREILLISAVCLISYIVHNMVSFQQVICTPLIFILMGIGEGMLRSTNYMENS